MPPDADDRAPPLPELAAALSPAPAGARRASRRRMAAGRRHYRRRRLQQLGRVGRAHALRQAAAGQRSAPAADGAVDLVSGAPGAGAPGREPPSMWSGATLAGVPLVVLGRSDTLAWGFTNTGPDVQDLFIEKINPDNPRAIPDARRLAPVRDRARWRSPSRARGVRNVERRRTRHGPVLPGFYRNLEGLLGAGHVAALQWTALERRRHHDRCRHVRSRHARRRATTWSACASTSCRCRAWWWPTRTATSA